MLLLVIKMDEGFNRDEVFMNLLMLEQTDYLDDNDRIEYITFKYKEWLWNELSFADKVYIEQVFDDYILWKDKQLLFHEQLEDAKRRTKK